MLSSTFNAQTIAQFSHRINKFTSALLSTPIKGYSGKCPFLRDLSTISSYSSSNCLNASSATNEQATNSEARNLFATYEQQQTTATTSSKQANTTTGCIRNQQVNSEQSLIGSEQLDELEKCQRIANEKVEDCKQLKGIDSETRCYNYSGKLKKLIESKKKDDSYRIFRKVRRFSSNFPYGSEQNRPVTIWCSNDYFGMSSHPKVCNAIVKALEEFGAGSGGTRNIAGNSPVHEELEWELADLHEKEAALLFSSCYVANDSTLFTLLKLIPNCHIFSDSGNHASMIQGIRNSQAPKHIFRTFDPIDLEKQLSCLPILTPKIVAFETVHSMTGDISDVGKMCDIAHKYGALTFVDEVHAVGLYGKRGAGIGQRDNCMEKIDIVSGTLGKAYGNFGGYIASSGQLVDVIRSYASGFIFTTSLPPTVACGAAESVRILKSDEGRYLRELQQNNVYYMKKSLTEAGLPQYQSKSHIIPIPVGDPAKCTKVSNDLLELGHYIQSINYPTVAKGSERLRVSVTPFHSEEMIDSLIENLVSVWLTNDLTFVPPVEFVGQCRRHQMLSKETSGIGHSLWCHLCHKEMNLCTRMKAFNR